MSLALVIIIHHEGEHECTKCYRNPSNSERQAQTSECAYLSTNLHCLLLLGGLLHYWDLDCCIFSSSITMYSSADTTPRLRLQQQQLNS